MEISAYSTLCYKLSVFSVNKGDARPINCLTAAQCYKEDFSKEGPKGRYFYEMLALDYDSLSYYVILSFLLLMCEGLARVS